jgi:hypothetical protein
METQLSNGVIDRLSAKMKKTAVTTTSVEPIHDREDSEASGAICCCNFA